MKRPLILMTLFAVLTLASLAQGTPLEDRVAALEKEAATLHELGKYAMIVIGVLGVGSIASLKKGASWVASRIKSNFERDLREHGIPLEKLSAVVDWKEKQDQRRAASTILVVADKADRALQRSLQKHGFRKVTVLEPGQSAVEAARLAGLVVLDVAKPQTWETWGESLARDVGRDDYLLFTGTRRVAIPDDMAGQILTANSPLTLAVHAGSLLARAEERRDVDG